MKESISNYGRIVIALLVLTSLIGLIFGGIWLKNLGKVTDEITPDATPINIEGRAAPIIYAQDQSAIVGRPLRLDNLITVINADGENITKDAEIISEDGLITVAGEGNDRQVIFLAEQAGSYSITINAKDTVSETELKSTKKITIVVNNSLDILFFVHVDNIC